VSESQTEKALEIKRGGQWAAETSAILEADFPISVVCSTAELDANFTTPISRLRGEQSAFQSAVRDASHDVSRATERLKNLADLALEAEGIRGPLVNDVFGALSEFRNASKHLTEIRSRYGDLVQTRLVISRWLSGLGLQHELQNVFYSNDLGLNGGIAGGLLLNRFAIVAAEQLWEGVTQGRVTQQRVTLRRVDYIYGTLLDFPVPAFGSKPTSLETLGQAIRKGSFLATITLAYETQGPALAIFTATTGILIWFGKPPAHVVRQATKNWLVNEMGVTEIEE
jgi:hypothetical protein